jgi:hypothetical protein
MCSAKATTQLYSLANLLHPASVLSGAKNYFSKFKETQTSEEVSVSSLFEYLVYVERTLRFTFDTTGREGCFGSVLDAELEKSVISGLKNGLAPSVFWSILGFREITEEQLSKLANVDYWAVLKGRNELVAELRKSFEGDFASIPLLNDIMIAEEGLKRLVAMLSKIKNG